MVTTALEPWLDVVWVATRKQRFWGLGSEPSERWMSGLDQASFTARFEREVVFFHRKTPTLICADALLNLSAHPSKVW
jgi:hypothetical protein